MIFTQAARGVFAALFILVTWLTVTPNPDDTEPGMAVTRWLSEALFGESLYADKIAHFLAYGALAGMAALGRVALMGRPLYTALALTVYGMALEAVQGAMGVRDPELFDALANAAGALAGATGGAFMLSLLQRRAQA